MNVVQVFPFVVGLAGLVFTVGLYLRRRWRVSGLVQRSEPLVEDGWLTFPHEAEYEPLRAKMQNEAFGQFCSGSLGAVILIAAGFGMDVRHNIFDYLAHLQ